VRNRSVKDENGKISKVRGSGHLFLDLAGKYSFSYTLNSGVNVGDYYKVIIVQKQIYVC
jgi:hypothetical protein